MTKVIVPPNPSKKLFAVPVERFTVWTCACGCNTRLRVDDRLLEITGPSEPFFAPGHMGPGTICPVYVSPSGEVG